MARTRDYVSGASPARTYEALRRAVEGLGYTIQQTDGRSMTIRFQAKGFVAPLLNMSASVVPAGNGQSKILMTGKAARGGMMLGEDGRLAQAVFNHVAMVLPTVEEPAGSQPLTAPASSPLGSDMVSELERLATLHTNGALDEAEFRAAKARLLADSAATAVRPNDVASAAPRVATGIGGAPLAAGAAGVAGGLLLGNVSGASAAPTAGEPVTETINYHETFTGPDGETTTIDGSTESTVAFDESGDAHVEIHDTGTVDVGGDTSHYDSDVTGDVDLGAAEDGGGFLGSLFDLF